MSGLPVDKDSAPNDALKKDVNATIRKVLFEVDAAAKAEPEVACHPYVADQRRSAVIQAIWSLYRQCTRRRDASD